MRLSEIETALGQRLAGLSPTYPVAWPNKSYDPIDAVPYVEFRHVPSERDDLSIDGSYTYQTGIALMTVVVEAGNFTHQANVIAQAVADRFPHGLRIIVGDEHLLITKPADFAGGFPDGAYFRQPVRVNYRTAPAT